MNYVVLDIETSMRQRDDRGKEYSDPLKGDVILTVGLKYKDSEALGYDQDYIHSGWLDGINLLVGHNIAFDLKFIWRNDELQHYFTQGGRIWDTQLVEYILSGQRHKYPALRDIAVNKYGCKERIKNIEGRNTEDVPIELLLEDVKNDVLDTEKIALEQYRIAKKEGMLGLIWTQMDARLCTIEMEMNGFKVDLNRLHKNKKELELALNPLTNDINDLAKKHWPIEAGAFNMNSPKQLVSLFFGGSYKTKDKVINGYYKNGNERYETRELVNDIQGLGLKPHKDWVTPTGNISVNEKILKELSKIK